MKVLLLGGGSAPDADEPPAWLAEHGGGLLVERLVRACTELAADLVFVVRAQDVRRFHIDEVIALAAPGAAVVRLAGATQGAACSALMCIRHIVRDEELLILNSNELLEIDHALAVHRFRARDLDAGVVTFPSLHPRYSYVRLGAGDLVEEASEKRPISRLAIAGFHWFRTGGDFIDAAQAMIAKDAHVDGRFFISLVLNELVLRQRRIGTHAIEARQYRPLKSRRQVAQYEAEGAVP